MTPTPNVETSIDVITETEGEESSIEESLEASTEGDLIVEEITEETTEETMVAESIEWSDEILDVVFDEVRTTLGNNYFPNMEITPDILEEMYGVTSDMYEAYYAEMPMISNNVDFLIGVKASEGNLEAVETALNKYVDALKADMMQYPSNLAKIPAATVETFGDYVFAVGTFGDTVEVDEQGDEAILELATEHINTTIDTIKNVMVAE